MLKRMIFAAGMGYVFRRLFGGGRGTSPGSPRVGTGPRWGRRSGW